MATIDDLIERIDKLVDVMESERGGGDTPRGPRATGRDLSSLDDEIEKLNELAEQYEQIARKSKNARVQEAALQSKINAAQKETLRLREEILAAQTDPGTSDQDLLRLTKELESLEEKEDLIKNSAQAAEELSDSFANIFSGKAPDLKGMLDPKNIQGMIKNFKSLKVAGASAIASFASKAAIAGLISYMKAAVNLAIDLGNMETQFMKATGANQQFARSITNSFQETRKFGATAEETSAAGQTLFNSFTDFTLASQNTRENLVETSAVMAKLGVSNEDFAKSIQISTKAMGMSADQAAQNMLNLEKFAENLGVAPQALAADFAGAGDMLAKMGDQGTKAFKDLAIVAKTTGMQMESILAITNKFDTFEGAADQAGKLNAALGGNFVNAMDLMMATDPAERFGMIRDSILDAGLSFDEMSYYQKNFYKESLGLSDVGELAALMSGDMDLVTGATQESAQSMIDAKKRAHEMATFQERLNTAFAQMIPILTPLIDLFSNLTMFIVDNMNIIKPLVGVLITLASVVALVSGVGTAGGVAGLGLGLGILFDSVETGEDSLSGLGIVFGEISDAFGELFDALGAVFKPFMDLFGIIGENTEDGAGLSIMITIIKGFARTLVMPIRLLTYVIELVVTMRDLLLYAFSGGTYGADNLSASFDRLGYVMGQMIRPLLEAIGLFDMVDSGIKSIGFNLFEKDYASNFLEGIIKVANAFSLMATGIAENLNPFNAMTNLVDGIGNAFSGVISAVTSFFTAITDPSAAENVVKIAEAISAIPTRKNIEFASSMGALAATNAAVGAVAAATTTANTITNFIGGGRQNQNMTQMASTTPQEVTINVMLDRDKLATVVQEINGQQAKQAIQGR